MLFSILVERERQRAIAKERLAARKQKKYQMTPGQEQTADQLIEADENSKMAEIVKDAEGNDCSRVCKSSDLKTLGQLFKPLLA